MWWYAVFPLYNSSSTFTDTIPTGVTSTITTPNEPSREPGASMKVAIVGGGSSGLAAAKACIEVIKMHMYLDQVANCACSHSCLLNAYIDDAGVLKNFTYSSS